VLDDGGPRTSVAAEAHYGKIALGVGAVGFGFLIGRWWRRSLRPTTVRGTYLAGVDVLGHG
jgi:hypothetical protein